MVRRAAAQSITFDGAHTTCVFRAANGEEVGWRWRIRGDDGWSALDDFRMAGILFTTHLMEDCWEADLDPADENGVRWLVHRTPG